MKSKMVLAKRSKDHEGSLKMTILTCETRRQRGREKKRKTLSTYSSVCSAAQVQHTLSSSILKGPINSLGRVGVEGSVRFYGTRTLKIKRQDSGQERKVAL